MFLQPLGLFSVLAWVIRACCLAALCLPLQGWGQDQNQDHVLDKAYWTDAQGTATFEQARAARYTPYSGVLSQGFGPQAQWIRLTIAAVPADGPQQLVLRIRPVFLDTITLFDPVTLAHETAPRTVGDAQPWQASEVPSIHHTFLIPAQPAPRQVWLRLSTNSTQLLHVEALSPPDLLRSDFRLGLAYLGLLALLFSFLVWVLLAWLRDRDPVNGLFLLRQTVLLLYTASFLGYHRVLLDGWLAAPQQDHLYAWLVLLIAFTSGLYEYRFQSEYHMPRWGHRLLRALLLLWLPLAGLLLSGHTRLALQWNIVLVGGYLVALLLVVSVLRLPPGARQPGQNPRYHLPRRVVVGYYLLINGMLFTVNVLPALGLFLGNILSIYGVLLYGLVTGTLMTGLLVVRSRRMQELHQEMANHLILSRGQLAQEQRQRQEQSQLLSMLMHELKNPLSVIDMATRTRQPDARSARYVHRAVDNIKAILERCIQTDRMVEREFSLQPATVHLSERLQQWLQERREGEQAFVIHIAPDLLLRSDLQCLQIVVGNLLDNALQHGQAPVSVSLQAQPGEQGQAGVLLVVSNLPGPSGWPDADQLFAKYYRSNGAQSRSGTGLGLYLSQRLATQLGGALRYRPDTQLIRFELWLPA